MLIAQGPLRVSLFGGGSDLPAFLAENEGAVLSFAIDRRVFIVGHPFTHRDGIVLKYSVTEDVARAARAQAPDRPRGPQPLRRDRHRHRGDVRRPGRHGPRLVILVHRRVPGLRPALRAASPPRPVDLAREACEIEIDVLKEPIGYQDQWASALGGVNVITLRRPARSSVESVGLGAADVAALEANLHLVPVGQPRSASELLAKQGGGISAGSKGEDVTRRMVDLVRAGQAGPAGRHGRSRAPPRRGLGASSARWPRGSPTPMWTRLYARGLAGGATGGKLLGAGGSGYLAFYVPSGEHERFAAQFPKRLGFRISTQGAGVIHES